MMKLKCVGNVKSQELSQVHFPSLFSRFENCKSHFQYMSQSNIVNSAASLKFSRLVHPVEQQSLCVSFLCCLNKCVYLKHTAGGPHINLALIFVSEKPINTVKGVHVRAVMNTWVFITLHSGFRLKHLYFCLFVNPIFPLVCVLPSKLPHNRP